LILGELDMAKRKEGRREREGLLAVQTIVVWPFDSVPETTPICAVDW
jgi:hypothetical protein